MTTTTSRPRGGRAEGVVQVLILLAIGTCAAAASFTHVHNVAQAHGQPGWLAWADAVVLELMSIATGLEIRRRHRAGQPAGFVMAVLITAVALSLAAQVVEAERSAVGWLAAALPALGFLACVKIVLSREVIRTNPTPQAEPVPTPVPAVPAPAPAVAPADPATVWADEPLFPVIVADHQDDTDPTDLLAQARRVATTHRATTGRDITRDQLRTALHVSTDTATDLLRALRTPSRAVVVPVPADTFARLNGHIPGGGR